MSFGPVSNSPQPMQSTVQPRAAETAETKKTDPAGDSCCGQASGPEMQGTNTPDSARQPADPEAQDAARQLNNGVEDQIRNRIQGPDGEQLEARRRTRSTRGGRVYAQGPVRGLGGDVA